MTSFLLIFNAYFTGGNYIKATCNTFETTTLEPLLCNISLLTARRFEQILCDYGFKQKIIVVKGMNEYKLNFIFFIFF